MKTTQKYMDEVKLKVTDIEMQSKEEIKQKLIAWDNKQWKHEIESKSSLLIYRQYRTKFKKKTFMTIDHHQQYSTKHEQTHYH